MNAKYLVAILLSTMISEVISAQKKDPFSPDFSSPEKIQGMILVWNDEFNNNEKPDHASWIYEKGFVRNQELQWYKQENANCANGLLIIEGRREQINNPNYISGSTNWKTVREYAEYTSASIQTRGLRQWQFGRFEIRARIDTACGSWPAIWTLGISGGWPSGGEIDIMEFYRVKGVPTILANFAWGTNQRGVGKWDGLKKPLSDFTANDPNWTKKFHVWRMDWNKDSINLFLDDQLLNTTLLSETINPDGFNPFLQPHYILLNLAIGANGGDPSKTRFPMKYEVDYVRVYQNDFNIPKEFVNPPGEFSVMPFWFWNDTLKDDEIIRQIADFDAHGVYGFVIHPRIGLPDNVKWLSAEMIHAMDVAISEASRRKMYVVLYDEGMYPSGSSSGQVVAKNPEHAAHGLSKIDLKPGENLQLPEGKNLITTFDRPGGLRVAIVDQPSSTDYNRAINICLEENYYKRLGNWCKDHGISLMGHPAGSMDIGTERYFQIPGQDLVWRYVEPGPKALEGQHSTMAKCASSAMLHLGFRRNANELYGAYGHNLTYDEMEWLANWCFVRGQNFLIPHAFYYSIRGPRFDERPPDVGPNASWWKDYKPFADACRRLSWLNTDSRQICDLAILCEATWLPDKSAKICYQHQRDFNYLEVRQLWEDAKVDSKGAHIVSMNYGAIIIDSLSYLPPKAIPLLKKLAGKGRLIIREDSKFASMFIGAMIYKTPEDLISAIDKTISPDLILTAPSENIRYRHVVKGKDHFYIIFNEDANDVTTKLKIPVIGNRQFLNPFTAEAVNVSEDEIVHFKPHELKILRVNNDSFKRE